MCCFFSMKLTLKLSFNLFNLVFNLKKYNLNFLFALFNLLSFSFCSYHILYLEQNLNFLYFVLLKKFPFPLFFFVKLNLLSLYTLIFSKFFAIKLFCAYQRICRFSLLLSSTQLFDWFYSYLLIKYWYRFERVLNFMLNFVMYLHCKKILIIDFFFILTMTVKIL